MTRVRHSSSTAGGNDTGLRACYRIWLEKNGRAFFGDGRARLLQGVADTGSLAAASRQLGMSYRTAWGHLNAIEEGFGRKLVTRHTGGQAGGGCQLTEAGKQFLAGYLSFRADVEQAFSDRFRECRNQLDG